MYWWERIFFGNIVNNKVKLTPAGYVAIKYWIKIPEHTNNVKLDKFIVMPNHIHGIIIITNPCRGVQLNAPTTDENGVNSVRNGKKYHSRISPNKHTLSVIIRTYKAAVTHWCRKNSHENFKWQRNYYEHIIRNEQELNKIRGYIKNNPLKWDLDTENTINPCRGVPLPTTEYENSNMT